MTRALDIAFRIGLGLFLVGGVALVAVQAAGLAAGSAALVTSAAESLGPAVYTAAGVTGIIAFVRSYLERWGGDD
ncbi:hypothetical protein [Marinitenerispora sediminis]|uniref:Uncharacterized protein n=1 Tax=Marinitenerispora sediminis TaxID=1931232 RepID=A0A368T2N7_9ACTN|nr:hypothetical protein [Marinitenerispora sediminis]RCV49182.1 hypothetical protein DEF28_21550 [Marinitenerispora sediminis]RCV51993.1 hypothetical protein DEF23_19485 [Marinitenerispora sediminis]RCV56052.1 hypothetical protein DEF24_17155 [Marinitenerispora sediminis]